MVYRSKKDAWLVALVAGSFVIPLVISFYNLFASEGNLRLGGILLLSSALIGAVILLLTYPLYYELTPTNLTIRSGVFMRRQIPLSEIQDVSPTRNSLGAPAWSLDRLQVNYDRDGEEGFVLISPEQKSSFMRDLVSRETGLEMRDERVVRTSH